jgi:hypothetical protein
METIKSFSLRRTIQPYIGIVIITAILSGLLIFNAIKTADLSWLEAIGVMVTILIVTQYPNTRYRICWQHGHEIKQIASNKVVTTIKTSEITRIEQERSDPLTLLQMRRPSRRIAIYADGSDGQKWIDVSLKHFAADDIRRLMRAIHESRPDLSMPKNWV